MNKKIEVLISPYQQSYYSDIVKAMEELQDYLVAIDPLKRLRRESNYGKAYADEFLKRVEKDQGKIFVAFGDNKVIGCIGGIIQPPTKMDLLDCIPSKDGRIIELFVLQKYRSHGIGQELMNQMEDYFRKQKCTVIRVEVFTPNVLAHNFYCKAGYVDRMVDMIKPVSGD